MKKSRLVGLITITLVAIGAAYPALALGLNTKPLQKSEIAAVGQMAKQIYSPERDTARYSATVRNLLVFTANAKASSSTATFPMELPRLTKFDYDARYTNVLRSQLNNSMRIFLGQPVADNQFNQVVAVIDQAGDLCTGTVISKRAVLTAAHCACARTPRRVIVGNAAWAFSDAVVQSAHVPDGLNCSNLESVDRSTSLAELAKGDVGILMLAAPLAIPPDPLALDSALVTAALPTIVGFGKTNTGISGIKNRADTYVVSAQCSGSVQGAPDANYYGCIPGRELVAQGPGSTDTCGGDSGGPILFPTKKGSMAVVGVTSRGVSILGAPPGAPECGEGGIYARVAANLGWIKSHVPDVVVEQ